MNILLPSNMEDPSRVLSAHIRAEDIHFGSFKLENPVKYIVKPSLEDMCFNRLAVAMWNNRDIRNAMVEGLKSEINSIETVFLNIEGRVIDRVERLRQPEVFQEKIKRSVKFIGSEIRKWVDFHCEVSLLNQNDVYLPDKFCFALHGTMDRPKTAEMIVKGKKLGVYPRYKWACVYCFRDDICKLWNEMPQCSRDSLFREYLPNNKSLGEELPNNCKTKSEYLRNMVCLWTLAIKKEQLEYTLSFRYLLDLLECCIQFKNKSAIEYFLQGLQDQSLVEIVLVDAARNTNEPDFLSFLLSKMTANQQLRVFKREPSQLYHFLEWPFQTLFMETVDCMWDILRLDYKHLLRAVINHSWENFEKIWQKVPHKGSSVKDGDILRRLVERKNKKVMCLVLQDINNEGRPKFYCNIVQNLCKYYLSKCDWSSLEFLIRECLFKNASRDELLKFKDEFENCAIENYNNLKEIIQTHKEEWNLIFKERTFESAFLF